MSAIKSFFCPHCDAIFSDNGAYSEHCEVDHKGDHSTPTDIVYECSACGSIHEHESEANACCEWVEDEEEDED